MQKESGLGQTARLHVGLSGGDGTWGGRGNSLHANENVMLRRWEEGSLTRAGVLGNERI